MLRSEVHIKRREVVPCRRIPTFVNLGAWACPKDQAFRRPANRTLQERGGVCVFTLTAFNKPFAAEERSHVVPLFHGDIGTSLENFENMQFQVSVFSCTICCIGCYGNNGHIHSQRVGMQESYWNTIKFVSYFDTKLRNMTFVFLRMRVQSKFCGLH